MNLYEKLVEIRKEVINFSKDTEGYGYKYVSGSQAIAKIRDKMDKLGIILVPGVGDTITSTYDYVNAKGKECTDHIVSGDMSYTWINAEGNFVILVEYPKADIKNDFMTEVNNFVRNESAAFAEFKAEEAYKALEESLDNNM